MKRRHRLRGGRAFSLIRRRRSGVRCGPLRVHAAPNRVGLARIGFVLPRAIGGAVIRNRLRRRLRELLQPHLGELAGYDLVVTAEPAAAGAGAGELAGHLERCLEELQERLVRQGAAGPLVDDNGAARAPRAAGLSA